MRTVWVKFVAVKSQRPFSAARSCAAVTAAGARSISSTRTRSAAQVFQRMRSGSPGGSGYSPGVWPWMSKRRILADCPRTPCDASGGAQLEEAAAQPHRLSRQHDRKPASRALWDDHRNAIVAPALTSPRSGEGAPTLPRNLTRPGRWPKPQPTIRISSPDTPAAAAPRTRASSGSGTSCDRRAADSGHALVDARRAAAGGRRGVHADSIVVHSRIGGTAARAGRGRGLSRPDRRAAP